MSDIKKPTIVDANYEGVKAYGNCGMFVYEGDFCIEGDVTINIRLIIGGDQTIKGSLLTYEEQTVYGNQIIDGRHTSRGDNTVYGNQHVTHNQFIDGNQQIHGNQIIEHGQYVGEYQRISGNQIVYGNQTIGKNQEINGHQEVYGLRDVKGEGTPIILNNKTTFSLSMYTDECKIHLMSNVIKIDNYVFTLEELENLSSIAFKKLGNGYLEWWRKWGAFILNNHKELTNVYGKVK